MNGFSELSDEIIQAVLEWLRDLLMKGAERALDMTEAIDVEMRTRPTQSLPSGEVRAKWRITLLEIAALTVESPRPAHVARGQSCYRFAWAEFSFGGDNRTVTIGWKFGPNFGRGDIYQINL